MNDFGLNIPQGYRLREGTDLFSLVKDLRGIMAPVQRKLQIREIARFCTMILDDADLNGQPRPKSVIFDALQAHNEHVGLIISGEHSCPLPRLTVFFLNDPETSEVYALAEVAHREYAEALADMEVGEYFPYWDETEDTPRPFGVRVSEWEDRGKIWARVMADVSEDDPTGVLRVDLGSAFADEDLLMESSSVLEEIPDMGKRINRAINESNEEIHTPEDLSALMAGLPARYQHVSAALRPICLNDLTGLDI